MNSYTLNTSFCQPKKDVAHKKPLRSGGTNTVSNLKLQSPSKNRERAGEGARKKGRKKR